MPGQSGHNTRPHTQLTSSVLGMDAYLNDLQIECSFNVFGLFHWHVIYGCSYTQAPADLWSTGAGIRCLYCMYKAVEWGGDDARNRQQHTILTPW